MSDTPETAPKADPVPPAVRDVLTLFSTELSDVRFGDLDADDLARLAERARARAQEVERARATLEEALSELEAAKGELAQRAEQALAHARIYASGDESLSARIGELESRQRTSRPKKKRRASKRKRATAQEPESRPGVGELPFGDESAA